MNNNKIYIAFNINCFSLILEKKIILSDDIILWPDGIFSKFFFTEYKKIPGRHILESIIRYYSINNIMIKIIGTINTQAKQYLDSNNVIYKNYDPGIVNDATTIRFDDISENDTVIIVISTPKQEKIASTLYKQQKCQIYCLGGALNMLSGSEKIAPRIFYKFGMEWLWRIVVGGKKTIFRDITIMLNILKNINSLIKTINLIRTHNSNVNYKDYITKPY